MPTIRTIFLIIICCVATVAQQTDHQPAPKAHAVSQPTQDGALVPGTRFVVKDGAIYIAVTAETLVPMAGGGASGCLPVPSTTAGQLIRLAPKTEIPQPPGKDQTKKN
jgi:hypothetical protein